MNHELCIHGNKLIDCQDCTPEDKAEQRIDSMRDIQIREELLKRLIDEERGRGS
jgi:hypothetical protein